MFEVVVTGTFSASHQLRLADGRLEPLHRHDWNVRVTCAGPTLDPSGMLVDFTVLQPRLQSILAKLQGGRLNDLAPFAESNPTAEHVAQHIATALTRDPELAARIACVEVEEEPGCFARYYPQRP